MAAGFDRADDPRSRRDGLGWVSRAVFPDPRLWLAVREPGVAAPPGWRVAARYAVVPSADRARFLLPLASRRVGAASTLAYNALRPPRVRANRLAVGVLAGLGGTGLAGMPELTVAVPASLDPAEAVLTVHLGRLLEAPLHAAIGIRPPDPHHKPTLQLFDDRGRPRAYAKIGWNDGTRAMARAEAAALRRLGRSAGLPDVPRLLCAFDWGELAVTVLEPMPARVRRLRHPDRPRLAAMLAVARRGGAPGRPRPLAGSAFLAELRRRAGSAHPDGADRVRRAVTALAERHGGTTIEFGDWHGDWVPWNLGTHRRRLIVWDWENSGPDRPVGFDLAHQGFQTALSMHGAPAARAAERMSEVVDRHGPALGLGPDQRRLVCEAYLLELWLRTSELAVGGAGWNDRLHPALLDLLAHRPTG
ncbi:hypothetical protein ACFFWC_24290 [Plantactinospora siamensis]|uniref:Aminoglycoside phosphotransferase domain-containing protein n=1 Tax=Plantactinospora siamensis TaxID=555372 RepID=A0ABV6P770_9ACTN